MAEEVIKVIPHDLDAEKSVLSSMMLSADAITVASELLIGDDFYQKQYGLFFDTMVEMTNEGKAVDPITLQDALKSKGVPEEMCSVDVLKDIMFSEATSANIRQYANIVQGKAVLRRIISANDEINKMCYLGQDSVDTILAETEKRVFALVQGRGSSDYVPIRSVVLKTLQDISKAYQTKGNVTGVATGFTDLDYMLSGLQPSDMILVAARPSMGKTAFVLNIASYVAVRNHIPTAIFSLEMSADQLAKRMLSLETGVEAQSLRTGDLSDREWSKVMEGGEILGHSGLIIDSTPGISIAELRSKCRKFKLEKDIQLVIIDYLQLMTGSGRAESHQLMISEISRSLKSLARELNVPVVVLSQLSRAVEQRPDHRPMLSDLRDSGAIEQDADVVMFIYREDYYNKELEPEKRDVSEIIIAKQRNGPIGTVRLAWIPKYTKFGNLERKRKENFVD